ncbi:hypothetical protein ASPZODRAFT_133645 [Penicilliopsis zonata CBS 506.65]|uniref:Elongation of fatty acids protein n=1 Tax=Penicilliopsis zonata CBS 506.65 TaxID=1073090 RepID=A0A1L9SEU5_9EURO|nr:hypothetical protein ASPZODRAFT_133645 [Penicilliopsis zonata CBS 506.65]OJJ45775.1 hypothetical protein ASPZODRAFT_133645 [Penicilliopsis zonata CBS 506.65]
MLDFTLSPNGAGGGPAATIRIGLPPASLLQFPPKELPATLPAPQVETLTWKQPFNIPPALYTDLLDVRVPITIAGVYAATVVVLNRVNKARGYKPYAFSKTPLFKLFVILHNIFLAIYSAWTCVGMIQTFRDTWPHRDDPHGLVAVTDALCKINGPRGYGNAAVYSSATDQWTMPNPQFKLGAGNVPDATDIGRLWNEGLAFLGWIFYLSKFYEVLDTAIILAKGKKSSTLQTYHHAGAMMCMWAGIRYMAAPIWIFTLVNSGIHALMYTYYTLTALSVRIPTRIKRSLTTMQITQFLIGTTMAASYLFISYTLPVAQPVAPTLRQISAVAAASVSSSGTTVASAATAESLVLWLKKLALRAAGAQGIAENVGSSRVQPLVGDISNAASTASQQQGVPGVEYPMVTCMDTTGQAFAIWLNVMYLLPLTYLFARFFVRSYLHRKDASAKRPAPMVVAEKAGLDALKGVGREIQRSIEMHGDTSEVTTEDESFDKSISKSVKTRAATKKSAAKSTLSAPQDGFMPVSPKKGAKRVTKENLGPAPSVTDSKAANPYEVLDREA